MRDILLFTADQAALHQVQAAVLACAAQSGAALTLAHYEDAASGLTVLLDTSVSPDTIAALLVDVTLPDGDGALLVDALRDAGFAAPLVMLHDTHVFALQRLGEAASRKPVAMVAKTSPLPMLVAALRRALASGTAAPAVAAPAVGTAVPAATTAVTAAAMGSSFFARSANAGPVVSPAPMPVAAPIPVPALTPAQAEAALARDVAARVERLSVREREVLALFAQGHAGKDVARLLGNELKTVFNQCTSIFEKTGVRPMRRLLSLLAQAADSQTGGQP